MPDGQKPYRAFISYSQLDRAWGERIHRWLETYRVPVGAVVDLRLPDRLGKFYRDDDDMPAVADLGATVRGALQEAESLIVVCSPRSAQSKWVNAEILHFRSTGRERKVFAVIIDGAPNSGDPETECFPPALRAVGDPDDPSAPSNEPMGPDVRRDGRAKTCARLAAGLLGVDFDDLWRRDQRRRRATLVRNVAAAALVALGVGAVFVNQGALTFLFDKEVSYRPFVGRDSALAVLPPGATFQDCRQGSRDCPVMVIIPEGRFRMGARDDEAEASDDERPQHEVSIAGFAVSQYDITFDDWEVCAKRGGCAATPLPSDYGMGRGRRPVVGVSWHDAEEYTAWLSTMTGAHYRLLTEAEWEYAARAGSTARWYWGDPFFLDETTRAHCYICTWGGNTPQGTEPVGLYPANAFGLYDMAGDVWQWVQDCYVSSYEGDFGAVAADGAPPTLDACASELGSPGHGPGSGLTREPPRVLRGGSWRDGQDAVRSASRHKDDPRAQQDNYGFRVARTIAPR